MSNYDLNFRIKIMFFTCRTFTKKFCTQTINTLTTIWTVRLQSISKQCCGIANGHINFTIQTWKKKKRKKFRDCEIIWIWKRIEPLVYKTADLIWRAFFIRKFDWHLIGLIYKGVAKQPWHYIDPRSMLLEKKGCKKSSI